MKSSKFPETQGAIFHERTLVMEPRTSRMRKAGLTDEALLRLASIVEGSDDAIIGKTLGGIVTSWNPGAERMFGYKANEIIGQSILTIFPDDRIDEEVDIIQKISRGLRVTHFETVRKAKDGSLLDVSVSVSPLINGAGQIVGISKIVRDISKEKNAQREIRRQAEEYQLAFNSNPMPMWIYDVSDFSFLAVNNEAIRHYGYSREEFMSMSLKDIRPREDLTEFFKSAEIGRFEIERAVWRHLTKGGKVIFVEVSSNPVMFNGREAKLVLANDITVRVDAEKARDKAEIRFLRAMDNLMEGCQIVGFDWRYKYVNDAVCRQGKKEKHELIGHEMMQVYPGIEKTPMFDSLRRCMFDRITCKMDNTFEYEDRTEGWFRLLMEPIEEGVFILSTDITEEKRQEEELTKYRNELEKLVEVRTAALEDANKELEAFSYSVSHDLRAPLRHIDGFSKLLLRKLEHATDEEVKRYLGIISSSTVQMGELIDGLLEFSRTGRKELAKSAVNVQALVDRAIRELSQESEGPAVKWQVGELPEVEADPQLLYQVIFNLLSNAVKYSAKRSDPEISIKYRQDKDEMIFAVDDNGVGFDMKYAGKLFGVFQRLHDADEFKGTGIGLANVRRIISRHGGRTWAEGEMDHGATFYFSIPSPKGVKPS